MPRISATLSRKETEQLRDKLNEALHTEASTITIILVSDALKINPYEEQEPVS